MKVLEMLKNQIISLDGITQQRLEKGKRYTKEEVPDEEMVISLLNLGIAKIVEVDEEIKEVEVVEQKSKFKLRK